MWICNNLKKLICIIHMNNHLKILLIIYKKHGVSIIETPFRLSKKTAPQSVNKKQSSLVRYQLYFINELFHLWSFWPKCQKTEFYTLCLLRHRSLPYLCTVCFAIPRLRPFSFVCQRVDFIDTLSKVRSLIVLCFFCAY